MEDYQLPQITIGARKKEQRCKTTSHPSLIGKLSKSSSPARRKHDLSNVMIWVRYNTHPITHTDTHTQHSNKVKKARNIRVKNNGRLEESLQ